MPSQFKQDNPGCDCCGPNCDTITDCECIQDGVAVNFPAFQVRLRSWRHVNDVFSPTSCTNICNSTGYNDTWIQYDPCVDGVTEDQPESGGGGWYMGLSGSVASDPCGAGFPWSWKIFLAAYRFSSTEYRVEVIVEEDNSSTLWEYFRFTFSVAECNCPSVNDTIIQASDVGGGAPILRCGRGGVVEFQWL